MGIILTDYVIESVLRDGLADLRDRPELLDDLFSQLLEDYLKTDYGQQSLNMIKDYVKNNKIYVVQSYSLNNTKMPCYSINLDTLNESERDASMQDYAGYTEESITPEVLAGPFSGTFSSVTSTVLVPDSIDLSNVQIRNYFTDTAGTSYEIVGGIINDDGNKKFTIDISLSGAPDMSGDVSVVSQIGTQVIEYQEVPLREKVLIGVYGQNDPNLTKYMYYLLMYFLHQRKADLETRGLELSNITASDFMREEHLPENVYCRYVSMNCLTRFKWAQDPINVFGSAGLDIRVPLDEVVIDDPTRTINTETE